MFIDEGAGVVDFIVDDKVKVLSGRVRKSIGEGSCFGGEEAWTIPFWSCGRTHPNM